MTLNYPPSVDRSGNHYPAKSVSFAATFNPRTVTFDEPTLRYPALTRYGHYTLDRLTAVLLYFNSVDAPFDRAAERDRFMWHYTCHVGQALF